MSFPRQRFVLDTTAFTDTKLLQQYGQNMKEIVNRVTRVFLIPFYSLMKRVRY